jgi:hypothetical protein
MGDLIDFLDKIATKYKFDKADIKTLGELISKLSTNKNTMNEDNSEFDYEQTNEQPETEQPIE